MVLGVSCVHFFQSDVKSWVDIDFPTGPSSINGNMDGQEAWHDALSRALTEIGFTTIVFQGLHFQECAKVEIETHVEHLLCNGQAMNLERKRVEP